MWSFLLQGVVGLVALPGAGFSGLMAGYFLWKYFALYLPNQQAVDGCVPSGGICSIDGMANLEISGPSGLIFLALAGLCLGLLVRLFRPSRN